MLQSSSAKQAGAPPAEADVVVAGAGPAGATVAALLAQLGYRVVILERENFPRYHIGESLTPAIDPLLSFLGLGERIAEAGFMRMPGHTFHWSGSERTSYFGESPDGDILGFQVWRARFDRLLLDRARELGVLAFTGHAVTGILRDRNPQVNGVRFRGLDQSSGAVRARLTVDATGGAGILARRLGARLADSPPRSLAIWGYWAGAGDPPGRDAINTFVESFPDGWIWTVRVRPDLRNVTVMVDLDAAQPALKRLGRRRFYLEQIAATVATRGFLERAHLATQLRSCESSWYRAARIGGDGWLAAGDATTWIDPLTSQGVRKAIASGMTAAVVANTLLREPAQAEVARAYGLAEEERSYAFFRDSAVRSLIAESRWPDRPFWRHRAEDRLGQPGPEPNPPRRGVLRGMARNVPLARLRLSWTRGARLEEKLVVVRSILRPRRTVVTATLPAGVRTTDLDLDALFPLVANGGLALPQVVDEYLARIGRGQDGRAEVLGQLERLVDEGACEVEVLP
jgi:flavin-dependent dehydrogenase